MLTTAMDETERMAALKKAYAEMILNTSKEAALRVIAAERKAQKFEQDLLSTKEEALRMLLRTKQMIDAKSREADITSLNQKRRIDELEAQLDEAEELIIDLRAKLSQVQDQLDDVKRTYMHSLIKAEEVAMPSQNGTRENEQRCFTPLKSFSELESRAVTSEVQAATAENSILDHECLASAKEAARQNSNSDHLNMDTPVFASVITKREEPELFCKRCFNRIHAIETGLVDVKLHSAHEIIPALENTLMTRRKGQNELIYPKTISGTDELGEFDIPIEQAAFFKDKAKDNQHVKLHKMHRRRTRYGKTKATSCRYRSGRVGKPQRRSSAISHGKSHSHTSSDVHRHGYVSTGMVDTKKDDYPLGLEEKVPLRRHQTVSITRRSERKRKIKQWGGFTTSCSQNDNHSCQYDEPFHIDKTVKCEKKVSKDLWEVEDKGELEEGNCIRAASSNFTACMNSREGSTFVGDAGEKNNRLMDKSMSEKQDGGLPSELELVNLSVSSELGDIKTSEMNDKAQCQPYSETRLNCTFSRKRKKGALASPVENNSFQQCSMKKSSGQETHNVLAPENSNCLNESSIDGRGLVQVARQLISLSSKGWC